MSATARLDRRAVVDAAARIERHVHHTPVVTSRSLSADVGAELFFKCENMQRIGEIIEKLIQDYTENK